MSDRPARIVTAKPLGERLAPSRPLSGRLRVAPLIAALPLLLLAAAAPAPSVPIYRTFGRWVVACDNTRSCEARGFDDTSPVDLRVLRAASDAKPSVSLTAQNATPDGSKVRLDGTPLPLRGPAWVQGKGDNANPGQLSTDDPDTVRAFIARIRNGNTLQFGGDDVTVPLAGLSAALLFMDAVQGRPGTATPLLAPAGSGQPLPALPLPRPAAWSRPPELMGTETRSLVARARAITPPAGTDCDRTEDADVYALDADAALIIRQCEMFAYQGNALVYVLPRHGGGATRPVSLPLPGVPKEAGGPEGPVMITPDFDPKRGTLSVMEKGRGIGDCGTMASWVWHDGAFRLTSLDFMDQCGGSGGGDLLTLYRTVGSE